jgi:hypothetical protein
MSLHLSYIKKISHIPKQKVIKLYQEHCDLQNNGDPDLITDTRPVISHVQIESLCKNGEKHPYLRVFVDTRDSGNYSTTGWVLSDDISHCMICQTQFSLFCPQQRCFACGNIICHNCSNSTTVIKVLRKIGPQRVCSFCYYGQEEIEAHVNYIPDD